MTTLQTRRIDFGQDDEVVELPKVDFGNDDPVAGVAPQAGDFDAPMQPAGNAQLGPFAPTGDLGTEAAKFGAGVGSSLRSFGLGMANLPRTMDIRPTIERVLTGGENPQMAAQRRNEQQSFKGAQQSIAQQAQQATGFSGAVGRATGAALTTAPGLIPGMQVPVLGSMGASVFGGEMLQTEGSDIPTGKRVASAIGKGGSEIATEKLGLNAVAKAFSKVIGGGSIAEIGKSIVASGAVNVGEETINLAAQEAIDAALGIQTFEQAQQNVRSQFPQVAGDAVLMSLIFSGAALGVRSISDPSTGVSTQEQPETGVESENLLVDPDLLPSKSAPTPISPVEPQVAQTAQEPVQPQTVQRGPIPTAQTLAGEQLPNVVRQPLVPPSPSISPELPGQVTAPADQVGEPAGFSHSPQSRAALSPQPEYRRGRRQRAAPQTGPELHTAPSPSQESRPSLEVQPLSSLKYPELRKRAAAMGIDSRGSAKVLRERIASAETTSRDQPQTPQQKPSDPAPTLAAAKPAPSAQTESSRASSETQQVGQIPSTKTIPPSGEGKQARKVYHATPTKNLESIRASGLSRGMVTDTKADAEEYAQMLRNRGEKDVTVMELDTDDDALHDMGVVETSRGKRVGQRFQVKKPIQVPAQSKPTTSPSTEREKGKEPDLTKPVPKMTDDELLALSKAEPSTVRGKMAKNLLEKKQRRGIVLAPSLDVPLGILKRNFTAAGDLPQPVFEKKVSKDAWTNSMLLQARFTLRDFDKAAKQAYGSKKLSLAQQTEIDKVLKSEADADTLPEPIRDVVKRMRDEVDALSRKMIDVGAVEGRMAVVVESNMGVYLTRSYRAFDDPKWAKKVPQDIRNKAKALLRSEYSGKSEDEIEGLIETLLYEGKAAESPIAFLKGSKLGAKDLSILTKRKGIAPEIRALWGEYLDPRQNYARSMAKMAHLIANHDFLTTIRKAGLGNFFHKEPLVKDDVAYKTRIAADESSVMHPLNGLYTTPEIKTAFEEAFKVADSSWYFRAYMRVNGLVKYSKTVLSITTHLRNLQSNTGFAVANGHWRLWKMKDGVNATLASIGAKNSTEWRDYYKHAVELGVVNESPRANELHDVIRDASKKSADELMDSGLRNIHKRLGRLATDVYRAEDDVWKIFAFENEKARYRKALPGKSEAEIEKIAAEIVRNTYPTYTMVPRAIKGLRRFPLVGTFVSFPWEVGRTGYHTMRLAAKELATPELRSIGAQRAAGIAAAATLTSIIATTTRMLLGISNDDDEDIRRFLPPWSENSQLAYVGRGEDGRPLIIDLSYVDPYNYLRTPVIALMRGKDWEESLWKATKEAMQPFFGEEILAGKVFDVARNKKMDGGPIWNPQDSVLQKTQDATLHIADALEPGTLSGLRRVYRGLTGYVSPYGRTYDPATEAIAMFTGQRVADVDVPTSLSFKSRRYSRDLTESTQIMSTKIGSRGTVDDDDIRSSVRRMVKARKTIFEEASKDVQSAIRQGMTKKQVYQTLRDAGLSETNARAILDGKYVPYKMSDLLRSRILDASKEVAEKSGKKPIDIARERLKIFSEEEGVAAASSASSRPSVPRPPTPPRPPRPPRR